MYESINMHTYQMEPPDHDAGIRLTVFHWLCSQMSQLHVLAETEIVFLCFLGIFAIRTQKIFCKSSYSMAGYTHFIKNVTTLHCINYIIHRSISNCRSVTSRTGTKKNYNMPASSWFFYKLSLWHWIFVLKINRNSSQFAENKACALSQRTAIRDRMMYSVNLHTSYCSCKCPVQNDRFLILHWLVSNGFKCL